jgi:acyl phosphate:glycerol-3-phosphate acyltransferase
MKHIGRKLYHLAGGLGLLSLYSFLGRERALWTYTILAGAVLVIDIARLKVPAMNRFFFRYFGSFLRENERGRLTGTAPYIIGIGLTLLLYRSDIATAAVCFLAVGDVAASTVGERYGRTKIAGSKTLEGTLAFVAAAAAGGFVLGLAGIHLMHGLIIAGALVAAAVEVLPVPLNDNLTVPLASGGVMELIARVTGCA